MASYKAQCWEALDHQTSLQGWMLTTKARELYYEFAGKYLSGTEQANAARWMYEWLKELLLLADTYWVSPDMVQIATLAAETLPDEQELLAEYLPTQQGFLHLASAVPFISGTGETIQIRAFGWAAGQLEESGPSGITYLLFHDQGGDELPLAHLSTWPFGDTWQNVENAEAVMPLLRESRRILLTLLLLLGQSIAVVGSERLPRPHRRRAERMGRKIETLTVVRLRKEFDPIQELSEAQRRDLGEESVWSHRWLVKPYFKQQHYGPKSEKRKTILVPAHVKGPADRPLVTKKNVYSLER